MNDKDKLQTAEAGILVYKRLAVQAYFNDLEHEITNIVIKSPFQNHIYFKGENLKSLYEAVPIDETLKEGLKVREGLVFQGFHAHLHGNLPITNIIDSNKVVRINNTARVYRDELIFKAYIPQNAHYYANLYEGEIVSDRISLGLGLVAYIPKKQKCLDLYFDDLLFELF